MKFSTVRLINLRKVVFLLIQGAPAVCRDNLNCLRDIASYATRYQPPTEAIMLFKNKSLVAVMSCAMMLAAAPLLPDGLSIMGSAYAKDGGGSGGGG
ncbi:hypothetical protein ACCD00_18950, partial [Pseudomonas sp. Pseusp3]